MDISGLSLKDLEILQKQIVVEIEKRKQAGKSETINQIRKLALENGYSLEELLGAASGAKRTGKPVAVKYRHPQDTSLTWTGRGRTPKWVAEWQGAHGSLDGITVK